MKIIYLKCRIVLFAILYIGVTNLFAQSRTVTGKVTSFEDGSALPGVTVLVKGTTTGTATDMNGDYTIAVPSSDAVLVFSYIGFTNEEVVVGNQSVINVALLTDIQTLSDVVVIGYGTQRREDLTGSVATVTEKEFIKGNVVTPEQMVVGKVAGLQVTPSGAPGGGSRIRIRGNASLSASNDPLIVVDGVPLDNQGVAGQANPLAFLNPNDIESINVLKDPSSTAIYGSRASNGVIIVTTKKGSRDQPIRFNFSSLASVSTTPRRLDVLNADEFRVIVRENATPSQQALLGEANTDWQSLIYRNAISHDHNLSISGSAGFLPYRVSLGYIDQDGILKTSNFKRGSAAITLSPTFFDDHLKINANWRGARTASRFANEGAIGSAISFDPTQQVYMDDPRFGGYFEWLNQDGTPNTLATRNPLSLLLQTDNRSWVNRSLGNVQLDYKFHFFPALRANLNLGYEASESNGRTIQPITLAGVFNQGGSNSQYAQSRMNRLADFYLQYSGNYEAIKSRVDVQAGYSYQDFIRSSPAFPVLNAAGDVFREAGIPFKTQNTLIGFFGRMNYALKDRYLLTATIRTDGSSRFAPENRWGVFPSVALAWRIDQEDFLRDVNFLSELKLRTSYGITGQQEIGQGDFPYLPIYAPSDNSAQYQLGDQFYSTLRPNGYARNIKWEETDTYNVGLDYGFLNGRITGSVDYFDRTTRDLLSFVPVPAGSNLTNFLTTNVGNLRSNGLEAALNFGIINTEKMSWNFGVNATYLNSRITKLSLTQADTSQGLQVGGIGGGVGNTVQIHTVGYRPFTFFTYQQVYDANGRPVEGLYVDRNGDGVINEQDLQRQFNPEPRVFMGFNSQFTYGKFSAGFTARASFGNYNYNNVAANTGAYQAFGFANYLTNVTPGIQQTGFRNYQYLSNYYLDNASFFRMENLNVGYDFGNIINDKASLRLTANVLNAFVITRYSGLDPEVAGGIDNNIYPRPRIYSVGLNLGF
jgi:TonB-linked SusC/RagA family outer membrane protein